MSLNVNVCMFFFFIKLYIIEMKRFFSLLYIIVFSSVMLENIHMLKVILLFCPALIPSVNIIVNS